ncbi:hypothetical protein SLUN_21160 [Streptomyces lunaelactis]|uniref:Uncharacterized protein n=1 Tax=Streptomyces lunaelactis TaxID=1535768 RepID=A0A2R4T568_9ACTN|nr:hypothetical protein [Streptomyces lunaelactis]AVZ74293.1 hypothetical protein SLUN_21160 [Streptomyces lunaelactis]NUK85745.1 hypothetical protein [Streptomyces lunaelactis]
MTGSRLSRTPADQHLPAPATPHHTPEPWNPALTRRDSRGPALPTVSPTHQPQSSQEWEQWLRTIRTAVRKDAITVEAGAGTPDDLVAFRLIHAIATAGAAAMNFAGFQGMPIAASLQVIDSLALLSQWHWV